MNVRKRTQQQAKSILSGHNQPYVHMARQALPLLVQLAAKRKTVTYEEFAGLLKIRNPRNLNYILGSVGSTLEELSKKWDDRIPAVQALVYSKTTGVPGYGFEASTSWTGRSESDPLERQRRHFEGIQDEAFKYPRWRRVLSHLGLPILAPSERTVGVWTGKSDISIDAEFKRFLDGYLDPTSSFISNWLPYYEETVEEVRTTIKSGDLSRAIDLVWATKDNAVSNAGMGAMSHEESVANQRALKALTRRIAHDPSPATFDTIVAEFESMKRRGLFLRMHRLLISRAFATIAPERYHTTVDWEKHNVVIAWMERHSSYRAPTSDNWAERASSLAEYLSGIEDLGRSIYVRNMFPWFVYSQARDDAGRPSFRAGHNVRVGETIATSTAEIRRVRLRHNKLLGVLHRELLQEHPGAEVGTEQPSGCGGWVDAVVRFRDKKTWLYELKIVRSAGSAIREAIGQLLEYAYHGGAWEPEKIFVVAEPELDAEAARFIATLQQRFKLPLDYRRIVAQ